MAKRLSKNQKKVNELFDKNKEYSLLEAMEIAKKTSYTKFDASVDISLNLNLDTRKAEQQLRGSVL